MKNWCPLWSCQWHVLCLANTDKPCHVGFFTEFTKIARTLPDSGSSEVHSRKKIQYFFTVENALYLKFRWAPKWSGVVSSCSSVCIKVWLEDCLCHTHLWSLLKTGSYVSAPICSYQDLWGWILGICLFNKLCKIFLMQSRVWDSEMEHWAFED